ncbi:MAG: toprim domain-containing protein [Aureliella sp.]
MPKSRFGPGKLADCEKGLADSDACDPLASELELLVVEGDSAAEAVKAVRDPSFQAVLPMQGKPLNAVRASAAALKRHELFRALVAALGFPDALNVNRARGSIDLDLLRYQRIVLLFDPDADGIHCAALMVLFFETVLPELLEPSRIQIVRPPLYGFEIAPTVATQAVRNATPKQTERSALPARRYAYSDLECRRLENELEAKRIAFQRSYFRGLGGIPREILQRECVEPQTRKADHVSKVDAGVMRRMLGGK